MTKPRVSTSFIYNVLGTLLPLVITIVTTPIYLRLIGPERYGVLALMWVVLGYFGLLDLGLSRASANRIAKATTPTEITDTFWAAIWTTLAIGVMGGIVLFAGGHLWAAIYFDDGSGYVREVLTALPFLALFVPLITVSSVLIGSLEARHAFFEVNAISFVGAVLFSIVPLCTALAFGPSLVLLIPAAMLSRVITVVWLALAARRKLEIHRIALPRRSHVRELTAYGGWAAVSSIIGTVMNSVDQIAIGAVLGAAAVAHYVVPYNVVTRLGVVPSSLLRALFPRLSQADPDAARELEYSALSILCVTMTALCVALILCFKPLLHLWLGAQLAPISIPIGIVLAIGVWCNSLANVPFWALQAQGRPQVPARIQMIEVGPYLLVLFGAMHEWGLLGAATAWSLRMAADASLLFRASRYSTVALRTVLPGALMLLVAAWVALSSEGLAIPAVALLIATALLLFWGNRTVPQWKTYVMPRIRRLTG